MKRNLTICAIDCRCPSLAARAIERTRMRVPHDRAVLFTDAFVNECLEIVHIKKISNINEYSRFIINELYNFIHTSHVLIVQWDGYAISDEWTSRYLEYDYIGAVWIYLKDGLRVGNGGFSLRSRKLLEDASNILGGKDLNEGEDYYICRTIRRTLESDFSARFAPENIASLFSYERQRPSHSTLGFHGIWNIYDHESDAAIKYILDEYPQQQLLGDGFLLLMINCLARERYVAFSALYKRLEAINEGVYLREALQDRLNLSQKLIKDIKRAASACAISNEQSVAIIEKGDRYDRS